jgi:aryl-alcohol dehydrogenase-like predicted oxidoreductase
MDRIRLGKNRIEVGRIGLGCMTMTGAYGGADPDEAVRAIHVAIDRGMTLLNTADFYGAGENERLIGRALKSAGGGATVSTKIGLRFDDDGRPTGFDGSPAHLAQTCNASLKRLDVERIDIVILGRVDQTVPIEDSVGALSELVAAGKAREIGLSEAASGTIRRANAVHPLAVLETEYSLWERGVERPVLSPTGRIGYRATGLSPARRRFSGWRDAPHRCA